MTESNLPQSSKELIDFVVFVIFVVAINPQCETRVLKANEG